MAKEDIEESVEAAMDTLEDRGFRCDERRNMGGTKFVCERSQEFGPPDIVSIVY